MVINSVPLRQLACPYIQEGFCVPLRKTSPIYKIHHIYIYRRDFAYPYAKPLLYYTGKILRALRKILGGILCTDCTDMQSTHHDNRIRFTGNTWSEVLTHGPGSNKV